MNGLASNKTRFYLLLAAALLFFPVTWKLALNKTLDVHQQLKDNEAKLSDVENNTPEQMALVEKRLTYLNRMLEGETSGEVFQNRVLDEVSSLCHQKGLLLREMPPMTKTNDSDYLVETINIQIAGSFHNLLQVLFELETPRKKMNLISAHFFVEENRRLKQKQLILSLYIQTLKKK